jgi:hypothetical protein
VKWLVRFCALTVVSIGAIYAVRSVYFGYSLARPSQVLDALTSVGIYQRIMAGEYRFSDLFGLHNEHRIPLGDILFLIDAHYFDFTNRFLLFVIYATLAFVARIISVLALSSRTTLNVALGFPAALGLTWGTVQFENLGWGFEVHFPLVHLFALLCFICVANSLRSSDFRAEMGWMLLAVVCDGLSVLTLTSGLITAFAALTLPFLLRRWSYAFLGFFIAHLAILKLYLHGEAALRPPVSGTTTWDIVRFFLRSLGTLARDGLGAPFEAGPLIAGSILFVGALGIGSLILWNAQVEKRPPPPESAVLLALISFIVVEVATITIGRIHAHPDQAIVSRYATHSVVLATAVLGLYWRTFIGFRVATSLAAILFIVLSNMPYSVERWRYFIADQDRAVFAIINGVQDGEVTSPIFPNVAVIEGGYAYLKAIKKGPFALSSDAYRPPVISFTSNELTVCRSEVNLSVQPGFNKFAGWIAATSLPQPPIWIVAYSKEGKMLGYTRPTYSRPDVQKALGSSDDMFGFALFLQKNEMVDSIKLIATFAPLAHVVGCRVNLH